MAVKIFTDAASNLFKQILVSKNVEDYVKVLPMSLDVGPKTYYCYEDDIDVQEMSKDFYEQMAQGLKPKTSLISPGLFLEEVEKEIKNGNEVLYISLAGGISGSYQSACMIADQINDENKKVVLRVINSKTASFGEAMQVLKAAELAKQNMSLEEIYTEVLEYCETVRSEFTVDSIKYLAQSGRVSKLTAAVASVLAIKPLLYGSPEGKIESTGKVHGRVAAIKTLVNQVNEYIKDKNSKVYIAHCNCIDDVNKMVNMLNERGINDIEIYYYDLVTGAHVGPGTIAVFYEGTSRAFEKKGVIAKAKEKLGFGK